MGGRGTSSYTAQADTSYRLQHRPGNLLTSPDEVASADKIANGYFFPKDMLQHPEWYFDMQEYDAKDTVETLRRIQGNPDAVVTIYRGASKGELNTGDWVTLSRSYAEEYAGDGAYSNKTTNKVYSYKAKASELSFDGDALNEFGYWGKRKKGEMNKGALNGR